MIVALVIALVALSLSLSVNAWLTYRTVRTASKEADERVAQNETEGLLERKSFEIAVTNKAFARQKKRADALEGALFHALDNPFPDADVDPADHRTRVRQLAEAWREAEDGDPLPTESVEPVSDSATTGKTQAPAVLSDTHGNELINPDELP